MIDNNVNWEIDHVFSIKAFIDYGIHDLKIINRLDNLKPLPKNENRKKQAIYNKVAFEKWLQETDGRN